MVIRMYVEYVNSRVRGMSSRLLDRHEIERLIAQVSVDGVITELEKTPYREEIVEARALYSGISCIESALRKNLVKTFHTIFQLVEDEKSGHYITIFLKKWDIQNIKTIIRGKNIHAANEEIASCLVPAGTLDETTLIELLKQQDVRGVVDLMATWGIEYARPLTRHIGDFSERRSLGILEYAMDEYYYESAIRGLNKKRDDDRIVLDLLGIEIDVTNIKNVLMLIRDHVTPEDAKPVLLEGGKELRKDRLFEMVGTGSISEAVRMLEPTSYGFLKDVSPEIVSSGMISVLEKKLDRYQMTRGVQTFRGNPLSFTIIIGYMWRKIIEITNIRVIARCREAGLPDDLMEAEIFHV